MAKTIRIKSFVRPALVDIGTKRYVVPMWLEVEPNTTLEQIQWEHVSPGGQGPTVRSITTVMGSRGAHYNVSILSDGTKKCSCVGFHYKKTCKHVNMV